MTFTIKCGPARSYGLSIICANQFSAQLAPELMQSLESNCAVRLTCHMDGPNHVVHFHLLQDINQPELLWIRPLLPAKYSWPQCQDHETLKIR